jgi:hypothetical protein
MILPYISYLLDNGILSKYTPRVSLNGDRGKKIFIPVCGAEMNILVDSP